MRGYNNEVYLLVLLLFQYLFVGRPLLNIRDNFNIF